MKRCGRCGTEISLGQVVCPQCGKPQRAPRRVRCRYCGTISRRSLRVCPGCGERLQVDWVRPIAIALIILSSLVILLGLVTLARKGREAIHPQAAVSAVRAFPSALPVLVEVPTLTPTLTPSVTPRPTLTRTPSPTPSLTPTTTPTPTPSTTPTPTPTTSPTASPTLTRGPTATATPTPRQASPTPTLTASPVATIAAPVLLEPEHRAAFNGQKAIFRLSWRTDYTLKADECFLVAVRYTHAGAASATTLCIERTEWYVSSMLYGEADQETDRAYYWSVRIVRRTLDGSGKDVYTSLSPPSEERVFFWR